MPGISHGVGVDKASGINKAYQNSGLTKPMFTAAQQGMLGEDLDFKEVFNEYFINEFEDPINSYMNVYSNAAAALAKAPTAHHKHIPPPKAALGTTPTPAPPFAPAAPGPAPQPNGLSTSAAIEAASAQLSNAFSQAAGIAPGSVAPVPSPAPSAQLLNLPTGRGIKTAWHVGALPCMSAATAHNLRVAHNGGVAVPEPVQSQNQNQTAQFYKKQKTATPLNGNNYQLPAPTFTPNPIAPNPIAPNPIAPAPKVPLAAVPTGVVGSAISERLGISLNGGGQLVMPQRGNQAAPLPNQRTAAPHPGAITLPVGVGIRLGGINGAYHPGKVIQSGGVTLNHAQWQAGPAAGGAINEKGLSAQVIAERRQRNREHAKRSRVRKKFLLESLQEEVSNLQKENGALRMLVQDKIPENATKIISECCSQSSLFSDSDQNKEENGVSPLEKNDFSLIKSLQSGQQCFVLSDPRLPDNPIVYASDGFYNLTGYNREETLGRNCRFLQGPGTDPKAVDMIRNAVSNGTEITTCLLNYKKDGTPFWNQFFVAPLKDSENCIVNYVGVQCAVDPDGGSSVIEDKVNSVLPLISKDDEEKKCDTSM